MPNGNWFDKAARGEVKTIFGLLYALCFKGRSQMMEAGLSTWGNVPDYKSVEDQRSQAAIRALEDANELVTMYLWHPEYFKTFLDYLQLRIPDFGEQEVRRDGLTPISQQDRVALELGVQQYVEEMRARL